jgi:hypothetical protein
MKIIYTLFLLFNISFAMAQFGEAQTITTQADGVRWIDAADIDGDGLSDILSANKFGSNISWYKNNVGGTFSPRQQIAFLDQTIHVSTGDLDGDGDIDVMGLSYASELLVWYENLDGLGNFSNQKIISTNALGAFFMMAEDIDADGDLDIIWGGDGSRIEWFENTDGLGNFGNAILIGSVPNSRSLAMEDLDNDGDLDLVSTSSGAINVWWFENIDGFGNFNAKQEIGGNGSTAKTTLLADFDNDGFIDVLAVYGALDRIVWHKNLDGTGDFSAQIDIALSDNVGGIKTGDIDNDGDIDILSASPNNPTLKWYENLDNLGNFSLPRIIEADFAGTKCLLVDIDNDGDLDAVRSSLSDDTIVWYENQLILSTGDTQLNTIKVHPNPADTALYVTGRNMSEISAMRVTTLLGSTIWEVQEYKNTINTSSWSSGSYFLELRNGSGQKRVIQVVKK